MKLCEHFMTKLMMFCLLVGVVLLSGALPVSAQNVNIPDANLRKAINKALGENRAATAAVTAAEMKTLTSLGSGNSPMRAFYASGVVIGISDLTGLEKATNLTTLHLYGHFTDISAVSRLTTLTTLELLGSFTDISAVSGLTTLTTLHLGSSRLTDISAVSGLTNLTTLTLSSNSLTDISAVSGLTNLTVLDLNGAFTDISAVSGLTNLTTLRLLSTFTDISAVSGLTNLTTLSLRGNGSTGYYSSNLGSFTDISVVSRLTNLTTLTLYGRFGSTDISAVSGLTNLTTLSLRGNGLTDISALSRLTNLKKLDLGFLTGINELTCQPIGEWSNLPHESVTGPRLSNISALSGLTNLTWLNLTGQSITDISVLSGLTNLTHLYLGEQAVGTGGGTSLGQTAELFSNVWGWEYQTVNCGSLPSFSNSISNISALSGLTSLTTLDLSGNNVSDLSPLVSNTGLGTGDWVYLSVRWSWGNRQLSYPSIYTHIPALKTRGVTVNIPFNRVPTTLTKVSGDAQTGVTSTALANPFVVEVKDGTTRSVYDSNTGTYTQVPAPVAFAGVPVTFAVTAGGGTLSATSVATDATGRAQVTLTPGATAVTQTVTATVTHAGRTLTQTFTATANRLPTFTSAATFSVAEKPATTTVGTVVATDADSQDSVTYSITGGADSAKFAITNAGVLTFAAAPNYEAPGDLVSTDPENAAGNNEYVIVVTATSGSGARQLTATQPLTITVTDVNEPPGKPGTPTVTAAATTPTSLNVSWTAPPNAGKPAITAYNLQYRKNNEVNWTAATYAGTATNTTLTGLTPGTPYDVQVLAKNHEGDSPWSNSGSTTTSTNAVPTFTSAATFSVAENATAVGTVAATDADSADTVTGYTITGGADSSKFAITNTGVLTFTAAPNYETPGDLGSTTPANDAGDNQYVLVVTATSGTAARVQSATQTLTITVTDVNEPPAKPDAPTVTAPTATPTRINVTWTAPTNTGPAITAYNLQYRKNGETSWAQAAYTGTDTRTTLTGLTVGTSYEVRVRAKNAEGDGPWSNSIGAVTATDAPPTFTSPATFSVAENTTTVGSIIATDANSGDSVTGYTITGGADSSKFAITNAGVLTFAAAPNYEAPGDLVSTTPANDAGDNQYVLVVTATSGSGARQATATQTLTITVTDVDEAPAQPAAPTVTAAAATPTQLSVNWTAPTNAGPAITDYDVRYRADVTAPNGGFTDAHYNGTTTSTTLTDLKPSTSYQVQVRARSDEGIGPWSDAGTAKTAAQPEDVDNDGDVDINDLLAVISNFGSASPGRNDVDGDNDVDADDIRRVFNELLTAERAAAGAPAQAARCITHTAEALHHYVQQTKQNGMLDGNLHRGLRVLEELIEPFLMPDETALLRNYPNPFNPETWLPYQLSKPADVTFSIYSVNGMLVRTLSLGYQAAGVYRHRSRAAYWDGRNAHGESVASGVYFYTLTAGDFIATGKMLIRK